MVITLAVVAIAGVFVYRRLAPWMLPEFGEREQRESVAEGGKQDSGA